MVVGQYNIIYRFGKIFKVYFFYYDGINFIYKIIYVSLLKFYLRMFFFVLLFRFIGYLGDVVSFCLIFF